MYFEDSRRYSTLIGSLIDTLYNISATSIFEISFAYTLFEFICSSAQLTSIEQQFLAETKCHRKSKTYMRIKDVRMGWFLIEELEVGQMKLGTKLTEKVISELGTGVFPTPFHLENTSFLKQMIKLLTLKLLKNILSFQPIHSQHFPRVTDNFFTML